MRSWTPKRPSPLWNLDTRGDSLTPLPPVEPAPTGEGTTLPSKSAVKRGQFSWTHREFPRNAAPHKGMVMHSSTNMQTQKHAHTCTENVRTHVITNIPKNPTHPHSCIHTPKPDSHIHTHTNTHAHTKPKTNTHTQNCTHTHSHTQGHDTFPQTQATYECVCTGTRKQQQHTSKHAQSTRKPPKQSVEQHANSCISRDPTNCNTTRTAAL